MINMKDTNGNEVTGTLERKDGKIIHTIIYTLEPGKSTLRGDYKKFLPDSECKFPDRLDCNSGIDYNRCQYMKCIRMGNWKCTCKE